MVMQKYNAVRRGHALTLRNMGAFHPSPHPDNGDEPRQATRTPLTSNVNFDKFVIR